MLLVMFSDQINRIREASIVEDREMRTNIMK